MRWQRTIAAGALLEVSFERARSAPVQGLVLEVGEGHLSWDHQGEEATAIRLWADRQETAVLRHIGDSEQVTLTAWHAWMDADLGGEIVRRGERMRVEETPGGTVLRCGDDDLVARVAVRQRARASSA